MKLEIFNQISKSMNCCGHACNVLAVAECYPEFSLKTLGSIYSQLYQKKMKKTHYKHYNLETMELYYRRFCEQSSTGFAHILRDLADEVELSRTLMARIVLERHLSHTQYNGEQPPKTVLTQKLKDTTLIDHPVLAENVHLCVVSDDMYGPLVDSIKHSIGFEHEFLLQRKLEEHKLAYLNEDQLRAKGYDKTPDFKLEVPIAVDGHVVNWIESKASFGDEDSHGTYLKEQFWSYHNRFGPGLVIYWFGFIDELDVNRERGILLMDHFPEDIVTMESLQPRKDDTLQNENSL